MKLLGLQITRLYGHYNYNIDFNSDVTFIYGLNGCGKTTVLNIIEAIITGQIYKLFSFDFDEIVLAYALESNMDDIKKIVVTSEGNKLKATFKEKDYILKPDKDKQDRYMAYDVCMYYFSKYKFLTDIKNTFNYVYLPLNRALASYDLMDQLSNSIVAERNYINFRNNYEAKINNKDMAMMYIEELIEKSCRKINSKLSHINDEFRNAILKLSLEVKVPDMETWDIYAATLKCEENIEMIQKTKEAYIKILTDLSLINHEEKHFTEIFDSLCYDIKNVKLTLSTALKMSEVRKVREIVLLAEKAEQEKADARKPIEKFLNIMNGFINTGEDKKELHIDSMGHVYFTTMYSDQHISIHHLSSGEKQLLTFFANLIFKVKNNTSGIFVVDEPELSLHLFWQKMFVSQILNVDSNIQLIFATHAPEIVGRHRDKMFRLVKTYVE